MPKGGPGNPALSPAAAAACAAAAAATEVGVIGLGVVGFSDPDSTDFFPEGAGVEEADDLPLRGLTGSFLALRSPFSFGGVLRSPLVSCCAAVAAATTAAPFCCPSCPIGLGPSYKKEKKNHWKFISQMCYVILL